MPGAAGIGEGGKSTWEALNEPDADEDMVEELIAETQATVKEEPSSTEETRSKPDGECLEHKHVL